MKMILLTLNIVNILMFLRLENQISSASPLYDALIIGFICNGISIIIITLEIYENRRNNRDNQTSH